MYFNELLLKKKKIVRHKMTHAISFENHCSSSSFVADRYLCNYALRDYVLLCVIVAHG